MHASEVWSSGDWRAVLLRSALTPASWLYALGWESYLAIYRLGVKRPARPHRPVLCVGNLMVGGTGKTPVTMYLAQKLAERGRRIAISISGYGAPRAKGANLAPGGPLDEREWGDESAMVRSLLPDVPLIVGRRRVLAAEICAQHFPDHILLMDDGFQHLPLRKDVTLLLDPPNRNTRCLPAGPYREPRSNRKRASLICPDDFQVVALPLRYRDPLGADLPTAAFESGYQVLCAIGQPRRFLAQLPGQPVVTRILPDHDPMTAGNLLIDLDPVLPVVVTAKDFVKLRRRPDAVRFQWILAIQQVRIDPEDALLDRVLQMLDESTTS